MTGKTYNTRSKVAPTGATRTAPNVKSGKGKASEKSAGANEERGSISFAKAVAPRPVTGSHISDVEAGPEKLVPSGPSLDISSRREPGHVPAMGAEDIAVAMQLASLENKKLPSELSSSENDEEGPWTVVQPRKSKSLENLKEMRSKNMNLDFIGLTDVQRATVRAAEESMTLAQRDIIHKRNEA
jgi:hypothetical protein